MYQNCEFHIHSVLTLGWFQINNLHLFKELITYIIIIKKNMSLVSEHLCFKDTPCFILLFNIRMQNRKIIPDFINLKPLGLVQSD